MRLLSLELRKLLFGSAIICVSATAANAAIKHVNVGAGIIFKDVSSGTSNPAVTTIFVGDTVQWDWLGGSHSSTSGACGASSCTPDGLWDSPVMSSGSFSHTFNTPGTFHYFCRPHQAQMQGMVNVILPPDFSLSISNSNGGTVGGPIFPSQRTVFNGNILSFNGYSNTVSLTCQPGASATPSPCTPNPASAVAPFLFTITAGAAMPGHYDFSAQATDGSLTHTATGLNFDVVDFGISVPSPSSLTTFPSATTTATSFNLTGAGAFSGTVSLACSGLPNGATCNFLPAGPYSPTADNPVNVNMTVTVPIATAAQDYGLTLSATSILNNNTRNIVQPFTLHVVSFTAGAFSPGSVTIGAGNISNVATTHLTATANFNNSGPGIVTLACTAGLPPGGACSFSPGAVSNFPSDVSVTTSVPFNTNAGSPALTVTATGNSSGASASQTQPLTLIVPAPSFSLGTPSPASLTMVNNSFSQPVTIKITPTNLAGVITPSCGNLPTGVSCLFSPSTINVNGAPTTFAVVFEANGAATPSMLNNITINGAATINGNPVNSSVGLIQLTIKAPDSSTTIASSLAAVNSVANSTLINVGEPNLTITATVDNTGNTYSAAVWEINFSKPVALVASSNPNCNQVLPAVVSCNIGDVAVSTGNQYSFKVAPLFERSVEAHSLLTSPSVGSNNLAGNQASAPAVQIRVRPLARKGLVPKRP